MNQFGSKFRVSIFGESHGNGVGITIDGVPAGLPLSADDFQKDVDRRKGGTQKGTTPRKEDDYPIFLTGLFKGRTTGAPLTIWFENKNTRSADYAKQRSFPRPGHADFVAHKKYGGFEDYRGGGHFSGRLTVCLVAAGVVAKRLMPQINFAASIDEIGGEKDIEAGLAKAIEAKDSIGGIVSCVANGVPLGIGEPFWDSVESKLAHAIFAIPAVKGIEFGAGFAAAKMFGSEHNDAIINDTGETATNHAGGLVGGISNSNPLVFRVAIKPTSSTPKDQETLNWETGSVETFSVKGRHDLCIALRVPPVLEAVTAMVLADLMMEVGKIKQFWPEHIYHIIKHKEWEEARRSGYIAAASLETEGFIHASDYWQVKRSINKFFAGDNEIRVLKIATEKLKVKLLYEDAAGEAFPHIYGKLPVDTVVEELLPEQFL